MFDKDGKLNERSQRILREQTVPPRYGYSPAMDPTIHPNMTATEVLAAEKAWAKQAVENSSNPAGSIIDEIHHILKENGIIASEPENPKD